MSEVTQVQTAPAKRRSRGRGQAGSVIERGGSYTIIYRKPDGKQKWEGGFHTKRLAQDRLNVVLGQISNRKFVDPQDKIFKEWCAEWLESKKGKLKPLTWGSYYSAVKRWILPRFGNDYVCDITRAGVMAFFDDLARQKSKFGARRITRQFMKNVHTILHKIFDDAIDRNFATNNPAHKVKIEGGRDSVERVMPPSGDVEKTFAKLDTGYQVLLLTFAFTGLRRGELLGLRWQDVELDAGIVHVRKQVQRVAKSMLTAEAFQNVERIGSTGLAVVSLKSKRSLRSVEIPPYLVTLLRQHHKRADGVFVFHDELGNPMDPKSIYKPLYSAQAEAKVAPFSPHGLRHLYCSMLQESGASVKHAQERMGHASASTTMNIYTRSITDEGRKYAEKIEEKFPFVSKLLAEVAAADAEPRMIQ